MIPVLAITNILLGLMLSGVLLDRGGPWWGVAVLWGYVGVANVALDWVTGWKFRDAPPGGIG